MKNYLKSIPVILTAIVLLGVTTARAQFYSYNSFVNGYNLQVVSTNAIGGLSTNSFGGTNVDNANGVNGYIYPGFFPAANTNNIGTNTIVGTTLAFGLQTNTGVIRDARVWPNNNSDVSSDLGVFISITGVNNSVTNAYTFTFASVIDFPIDMPPPSPNSSLWPPPGGTGTITNATACTQVGNQFTVTLTANGLTPVNLVTNPPNAVIAGAAKLRLLSVATATTNILGIATNYAYSMVLTNGVWQQATNTITTTNWGVYVNAGVVGYPPFHSP